MARSNALTFAKAGWEIGLMFGHYFAKLRMPPRCLIGISLVLGITLDASEGDPVRMVAVSAIDLREWHTALRRSGLSPEEQIRQVDAARRENLISIPKRPVPALGAVAEAARVPQLDPESLRVARLQTRLEALPVGSPQRTLVEIRLAHADPVAQIRSIDAADALLRPPVRARTPVTGVAVPSDRRVSPMPQLEAARTLTPEERIRMIDLQTEKP